MVSSIGRLAEELVYLRESLFAIIIVGIDNCKRSVDVVSGGQYSMAGAPGLCSAFRN